MLFPEKQGHKTIAVPARGEIPGASSHRIFTVLKGNIDFASADSLLKIAAHSNPRKFYDYAAVSDRLGARIRSIQTLLCYHCPDGHQQERAAVFSRLSTCSYTKNNPR